MSKKYFSIIPGFALVILTFYAHFTRNWQLFGLQPPDVTFSDSRVLTSAALCASTVSNWDPVISECDSFGLYNYPKYWATIFGQMGITTNQTDLVGLVFIGLMAFAISFLCYQSIKVNFSWLTITFFTIMALSPPIILLSERGNTDSFIFFIVVVSSFLVSSGKGVLSIFLIVLAGFLKVYPFGGFLGHFSVKPYLRFRVILFILFSALASILLIADLGIITSNTPQSNYASFGAKLIPYQFFGPESSITMPKKLFVSGLIFFGSVTSIFWLLLRLQVFPKLTSSFKALVDELLQFPILASSFVTGVGVFTFTYIIGISWDYRLVYLFVPVAALITVKHSAFAKWLLSFILLEMYFSYLSGSPNEAIGDWIWLLLAPVLLLVSLEIIFRKQEIKFLLIAP